MDDRHVSRGACIREDARSNSVDTFRLFRIALSFVDGCVGPDRCNDIRLIGVKCGRQRFWGLKINFRPAPRNDD